MRARKRLTHPKRIFVSPAEAFDIIDVGKSKGWVLIRNGTLESCKLGNRRLVALASVEMFARKLLEQSKPAT